MRSPCKKNKNRERTLGTMNLECHKNRYAPVTTNNIKIHKGMLNFQNLTCISLLSIKSTKAPFPVFPSKEKIR